MKTLDEAILEGYKHIDLPNDDTTLKEFIEEIYKEFYTEIKKLNDKIDKVIYD